LKYFFVHCFNIFVQSIPNFRTRISNTKFSIIGSYRRHIKCSFRCLSCIILMYLIGWRKKLSKARERIWLLKSFINSKFWREANFLKGEMCFLPAHMQNWQHIYRMRSPIQWRHDLWSSTHSISIISMTDTLRHGLSIQWFAIPICVWLYIHVSTGHWTRGVCSSKRVGGSLEIFFYFWSLQNGAWILDTF
jgi:hypothetical protein